MAKTAQELLDMIEELDVYVFATVDAEGFPRTRIISALHCGNRFEHCPVEAIERLG